MSDVIKFGRIQYIEPNEIFGSDNQPVNQEDLSKYVNLYVKIPSRYYNENNWIRKYDTILRGENFEKDDSYAKFYLTDNYVNVSYTEYGKNGEISVGELFGIDSIDISFDVQFFPQVTINFTDIKGFGLMSTMEYSYSENKINDITAKSFFTSLFNFPYPIFTLEVKGYYGKSVSFDLSLSDFHTSFDSVTGNFKTTVKFIGHMYGVYTDIPMTYLMISPYLFSNVKLTGNTMTNGDTYSNTWTSIREGYPTYLEFLNSFNNILIGDFDSSRNIEKYRENQKKIVKLLEVKEIIDNIIEMNKTNNRNILKIFYYLGSIEELAKDSRPVFYMGRSNSDLTNSQKSFKYFCYSKTASTVEFKKTSNETVFSFPFDEKTIENIYISDLESTELINNNSFINEYNKIRGELPELILKYVNKNDEILISTTTHEIRSLKTVPYLIFENLQTIKEQIEERINDIEEENQHSSNELTQTLRQIVTNTIGFDPCIKNYYKLLFKHLNCFTKNFYNIIDDVNTRISNRQRKLSEILKGYETDIKKNIIEDELQNQQVPQFPLVMNNEGKIIYPGEVATFQNEPEIKLVNEIYSSMIYFGSNSKNIFNTITNNKTILESGLIIYNSLLFNDLMPSEFTNENGEHIKIIKNYGVLNDRNYRLNTDDEIVDTVKKIFLSRLCLYNRIHAPKNANWGGLYTDDSASIADMESELLKMNYAELCNLYPDFYEKLKNISKDDVIETYKKFDGLGFGIINYKPGMEKIQNINDLFKYDIHINDIESSVLVLKEGSFNECSEYLSQIGFTNRKNESNTMTSAIRNAYDDKDFKMKILTSHTGERIWKEDVAVRKYTNSNSGYVVGIDCGNYTPSSLNLTYNKNYYTQSSFIANGKNNTLHVIYTPFIYANDSVLNWTLDCEHYYYSGKQYQSKICDSDGLGITSFKYESDPAQTNRINNNKISIIRLDQLRALGEFFENADKGCILGYYNNTNKQFIDTKSSDLDEYLITEKNILPYVNRFYSGFDSDNLKSVFKNFCKDSLYNENSKYYDRTINEKNYYLVIAKNYQYINNNNTGMTDVYINTYWEDFVNKIGEKYGVISNKNIVQQYEQKKEKETEALNLKTNIYYTLKNLYDKWFCSLDRSIFDLTKSGNESSKFKFLNVAMDDISTEMVFNYETAVLQIKETLKGSTSVMEFMAQTAEKNKSTFLTLPINVFDNTSEEELKNIFKPFSFYNQTTTHDSQGVSYIFIHNGDLSHFLNIENSEYDDDGYDMVSYNGNGITKNEIAEKIFNDHDTVVNAFGVTYGMQNQNYFKSISVDTSNPTITDYSIANTLIIAEGGDKSNVINDIAIKEKSLYPIYSNRSYNCTVEMLGCMHITPLMYFQLNNIPMFRGAYIITNVNHKITPNDFTTIFTGVRVSKYKIPINVETVSLSLIGFGRVSENNNEINYHETTTNSKGSPINIKADNDVVNLNIKDGVDCKCFFKYHHDCVGSNCDCHRSAELSVKCLLEKHGINDDGSYARTNAIRLEYEKNNKLYYFCLENEDFKDKYNATVNSIITHLQNKKPVIVGVNHTYNKKNKQGKPLNEGTSDHWVTIYAYGYSGDTLYFRYFETGSDNAMANNREDIFLFENGDKPKLYNNRAKPDSGSNIQRRYDVTVVKLWHNIENFKYKLHDYHNETSVSEIPIS